MTWLVVLFRFMGYKEIEFWSMNDEWSLFTIITTSIFNYGHGCRCTVGLGIFCV